MRRTAGKPSTWQTFPSNDHLCTGDVAEVTGQKESITGGSAGQGCRHAVHVHLGVRTLGAKHSPPRRRRVRCRDMEGWVLAFSLHAICNQHHTCPTKVRGTSDQQPATCCPPTRLQPSPAINYRAMAPCLPTAFEHRAMPIRCRSRRTVPNALELQVAHALSSAGKEHDHGSKCTA